MKWRWLFPLTILALVAGLGAGLYYSWVAAPMRYVDTTPSTLRTDFKDQFRTLIAASYASTHNLDRARARLVLLGDPDPVEALTAQAQRMLASGESFRVVQDVAGLASDLRSGVASVPSAEAFPSAPDPSPAPTITIPTVLAPVSTDTAGPSVTGQVQLASDSTATPTISATAPAPTVLVFDTPTSRPSATPIPTASAPFQLVSQDQVCNANLTSGLMQISILDSHKHQMPGVEIDISWNGGEEAFFTGLKPEIADGYADYVMQAGVVYSLRIANTGAPITNLAAPSCPTSNAQTYLGGLKLVFQQP